MQFQREIFGVTVLVASFLVFAQTGRSQSVADGKHEAQANTSQNADRAATDHYLWGRDAPTFQFVLVGLSSREEEQRDYAKAIASYQRNLNRLERINASLASKVYIQLKLVENLIETERWPEAQPILNDCRRHCLANAPISMRTMEVECYQTRVHINNHEFDKARESLALVAKHAPPSYKKNPSYQLDINKLRCLLAARSQSFTAASEVFDRAFEDLRTFATMGENFETSKSHKLGYQLLFDWYCQCFAIELEHGDPCIDSFYDNVMSCKGFSTDWSRMIMRRRSHPDYWSDSIRIEAVSLGIDWVVLGTVDETRSQHVEKLAGQVIQRIDALDAKANPDGAWRTQLNSEKLKSALSPDEVFVDFVAYRKDDGYQLLALISETDAPVRCLALGSMESLTQQVIAWNDGQGESTAAQRAGVKIRQTLWEPLKPFINKGKKVVISPDGIIGFVSFGSLPSNSPGRFLVQDHLFTYQISASDFALTRLYSEKRTDPQCWCLLGNPDFGESTTTEETLAPLPATQGEVEKISSLIESNLKSAQINLLVRDKATVSRLRQHAPSCTHLHLATHGFRNIPESFQTKNRTPGSMRADFLSDQYVGLALAKESNLFGFLTPKSIITAADIQRLDLTNVELVVLSGCETGTGIWEQGEGMASLNRAFRVAGARQIVSSIWPVPDDSTRELMKHFYNNLINARLPVAEALRQAQIMMIKRPRPSSPLLATTNRGKAVARQRAKNRPAQQVASPYHWGGFVAYGTTATNLRLRRN